MKPHSRFRVARRFLIFWTLFIGIGAVAGAMGMLIDPSGKAMGMDAMLPYFQKLPFAEIIFQDLTFSGWALLIVNGLTNLTAAALLFARKRSGVILGGIFGVTLMLWICIQFYMFPLNFMSTIYFVFGFCQAATGYAAWVFSKQEAFRVDREEYSNIGRNPKRLVVYFSRLGYVESRRIWRRSARALRYMRSGLRSGRRERWASGGAAATGCTAGKCPSSRLNWICRPMNTLPFARRFGFSRLLHRCGAFVDARRGKFGKRITF